MLAIILSVDGFVFTLKAAVIIMLFAGGFVFAPIAAVMATLFAGGFIFAALSETLLLVNIRPSIKSTILKHKFFIIKPS